MSVLVYVDHTQGAFKKKAFEIVNYAAETAKKTGGEVIALALGTIEESELAGLGAYGATRVLHVNEERLNNFSAAAHAKAVVAAVQETGAKVVVTSYNVTGKSVAAMAAQQ